MASLASQTFEGLPGVMITMQGVGTGQVTVTATESGGALRRVDPQRHVRHGERLDDRQPALPTTASGCTSVRPRAGSTAGSPRAASARTRVVVWRRRGESPHTTDGAQASSSKTVERPAPNCHGPTASNGVFNDVSHTPEQIGGFSDDELIAIIPRSHPRGRLLRSYGPQAQLRRLRGMHAGGGVQRMAPDSPVGRHHVRMSTRRIVVYLRSLTRLPRRRARPTSEAVAAATACTTAATARTTAATARTTAGERHPTRVLPSALNERRLSTQPSSRQLAGRRRPGGAAGPCGGRRDRRLRRRHGPPARRRWWRRRGRRPLRRRHVNGGRLGRRR